MSHTCTCGMVLQRTVEFLLPTPGAATPCAVADCTRPGRVRLLADTRAHPPIRTRTRPLCAVHALAYQDEPVRPELEEQPEAAR